MLFPIVIQGKTRRPIIPRSQNTLIAHATVLNQLITRILESDIKLIEYLKENTSYSTGIQYIRLLQWMGLIDPYQCKTPYTHGINSIIIKPTPLLELMRKDITSGNQSIISCLTPLICYLLPTPYRTVIQIAQKVESLNELAQELLRHPRASERIIAQAFLTSPGKNSDLLKLLVTGYSTGVIRPGKQSDPGKKLAYIRTQGRSNWQNHPCYKKAPILGVHYRRIENILYGITSEQLRLDWFTKKIGKKQKETMEQILTRIKQELPQLHEYYNRYYNIEEKPHVNCLQQDSF